MIDVKELYITVIEKNSNKVKNQTHKRRRADRLVRNHSLSALFMFKKAIFTKSADCVLQLTKGIMMECKVCQQQNRIAIGLSKKAEPLTRTIAPMDMNTHIM